MVCDEASVSDCKRAKYLYVFFKALIEQDDTSETITEEKEKCMSKCGRD